MALMRLNPFQIQNLFSHIIQMLPKTFMLSLTPVSTCLKLEINSQKFFLKGF